MHLDDEKVERFLEAEVNALLRNLDHEPPLIDASEIAARAGRLNSSRKRWAAGLLLAAVAGSAAIAAPGLPIRGWLTAAVERIAARPKAIQAVTTGTNVGRALAGVSVDPGQELQILFTSAQRSGAIHLTLVNHHEVFVRTVTGAATFTLGAGRLVIDNKGTTERFDIGIPRSAPRVEIRVAGTRVFLKQNARIAAPAPLDAEGFYVIPIRP